MPESWARTSHILCSSKGRAPALSGSPWGIQSLLCLHPIGVCECRDSHSTGVLLNGDEDLGRKGRHGQWAPRGWSRYGGLFRGLRQLLKRGLRVGGVGHAEPAGNARRQEKRWSLRQVGVRAAGEQQAMRSGGMQAACGGQGAGGGPQPWPRLIPWLRWSRCRLSRQHASFPYDLNF